MKDWIFEKVKSGEHDVVGKMATYHLPWGFAQGACYAIRGATLREIAFGDLWAVTKKISGILRGRTTTIEEMAMTFLAEEVGASIKYFDFFALQIEKEQSLAANPDHCLYHFQGSEKINVSNEQQSSLVSEVDYQGF